MDWNPARSRKNTSIAIEQLEGRRLLSVAVANAHGALAKIGDQLSQLYQKQNAPTIATATAVKVSQSTPASSSLLHAADGYVQIDAYSNKTGKALAKAIEKIQGKSIRINGRGVSASVPISALAALSKIPSLRFAEPALYTTNTGSITSQGDIADRANLVRNNYGLTGAGVTVGIISDSFKTNTTGDKYADDIKSLDLPDNVQVLQDQPGKTDEGRAIAQLIYDSAPGASLVFQTGIGGQPAMATAIGALQSAGAKVIVDDFTYYNEPMFQDGAIAKAATAAVNAGVSYFAAAGNNAQNAYENAWSSAPARAANTIQSAAGAPQFYGGTPYNFAPAGQDANDMQSFTLAAGANILLSVQWDSPYFSASGGSGTQNNVDAYVLDSTGTIVGGSANLTVGGDPVQVFQFTNTTGASNTFKLMLVNEVGSVPGYLKYVDFSGQATGWSYTTNSGAIFGHANAAGVESVGSSYYCNTPAYGTSPAIVETNSSSGPTPILFSATGVRLATPIIRQSPSIVAPDGGSNTFFGTKISNGNYSFNGTSAAAAEAASVAALILQKAPSLTPAQVATAINSTAADMNTPGFDFKTGFGLIQADAAIASVLGKVTGAVFYDNNGNGIQDNGEPGVSGSTVFVDTNNNSVLDSGEISTSSAANGTYTLNNVPMGSSVIRQTLPAGYIATSTAPTVAVPGNGGTVSTSFGVFPTSFATPGSGSSLLLQIDPAKTTFVQIYVGGVLTYTAAKSILPALAFTATGNNNTITINFANGTPVPAGGISCSTANGAINNTLVCNGGSGSDSVTIDAQVTTFNGAAIFESGFTAQVINGNNGTNTFNFLKAQPSTEAVTFNGGTGNTSLTVKYGPANNGVGTIFNAGTSPTSQNTLTVNGGTFLLPGDPATTSANLTVNDNATVIFTGTPAGSGISARHLAALNIGATAIATINNPTAHSDRSVLVLNSLSITAGGKLDLGGNDMIVHNGTLAALAAAIGTGFNQGTWNGAGIQSTVAQKDSSHLTALGIALNSTANATPAYDTFDGQSGLITTDVLVKYTFYGDANLNGMIDGTDYSQIDNGFGSTGILTGWANGDFNYTNTIDGSDYSLIDNAFNTQGTPL